MGLIVINNNNLKLSSKEGVHDFAKLYVGWINQTYSNFFNITGYFTRLDWMPS